MVSEAGTERLGELEVRPTVPPPEPLRLTVQVLEAPGGRVPGLHAIELTELFPAATVMVPPAPVTAIGLPVGEAPRLLAILTGTELPPDKLTDSVAITPSAKALAFNPQAMHV
jgi:hypothetical protein